MQSLQMNWRSFLSLKAYALVAFVVIWNLGFLYAMHLGGGGLAGGLTPIGMKVTGYVCLAACIFALSVAMSKSLQSVLVAPSRAHNFNPKEFYFMAFITGILAISRFLFPLSEVAANAF